MNPGHKHTRVDVSFGEPANPSARRPDVPFRILILGNFSGREIDGEFSRPAQIDKDNFDTLLSRMKIRLDLLRLPDATAAPLEFHRLDDFHPDAIFAKNAAFAQLRDLRGRLGDMETFAEAAAELRDLAGLSSAEPSVEDSGNSATRPTKISDRPTSQSAGLLDDILDSMGTPSDDALAVTGSITEYIHEIAERHSIPAADPQQPQMLDLLDEVISHTMNAVLHDPQFQNLEALWRGLDFVVRRTDLDAELQLFVLDLSKHELAAALADTTSADNPLRRLLVEETVKTPGADPWGAVFGAYTFSPCRQDAAILQRIASLTAAAGAPFVAAAAGFAPDLELASLQSDSPSPDETDLSVWDELRSSSIADGISLMWPRLMLRLPYGESTRPVDDFAFEEMPKGSDHSAYLWGNPVFAAACVLGESFSRDAWQLRPEQMQCLDGLPVHVYEADGESTCHSCGEYVLRESDLEYFANCGISPLISFRDQDRVALRMYSLGGTPLRAAWT